MSDIPEGEIGPETPLSGPQKPIVEIAGRFKKGNKAGKGPTPELIQAIKDRAAALKEAWSTGCLDYKLQNRPILKLIKDKWLASKAVSRKFYIEASRRTGKSSLGLLLLTEHALRHPDTDCLYVAPVKKHLANYIRPIYRDLFADCPAWVGVKFLENKGIIEFANGSRIIFVGSNRDTYESSIRSNRLSLIFIDEAREIDDFQDMITSAALPALFDSDGYLLISSTPATMLDHELHAVMEELKALGAYHHNTVHEVGYPEQRIQEFEKETCGRVCKGNQKHAAAWLREYLAEWVKDASILIMPEFNRAVHVQTIPKDRILFEFYYKTEAMDQGGEGTDKTVILFGYYRFGKTPSCIIERNLIFTGNDARIDVMAAKIRQTENVLGYKNVYRRTADTNDRIMLKSLNSLYGFNFSPVEKIYGETVSGYKGLRAMVEETRVWFTGDPAPIAIDPSCTELIGALENCVWDTHGKFARSKTYGHADAIAALIYYIRSLPLNNPFPAGMNFNPASQFSEELLLGKKEHDDSLDALRQAFNNVSDLERKY